MVRTKADPAGVKASGGKAPRKASLTPSGGRSGGREGKAKQYSGGNSYCPRETPPWQKQITTFFAAKPETINPQDSLSNSSEQESPSHSSEQGSPSHSSEGPSRQEDSE